MNVWTIVVAAGSGSRFGGAKQFAMLAGQRVIDRSIKTASEVSNGVVVVAAAEAVPELAGMIAVDSVVVGGATRSESVRAGLAAVPQEADIVVVHDAARPLATAALYASVIESVNEGADASIPGIAVTDTIKRVNQMPTHLESAAVIETVDRSELVAVQTPQAFSADALRRAHIAAPEASDDAGLIEALGGLVTVVPGLRENTKITVPEDLVAMEAVMTK